MNLTKAQLQEIADLLLCGQLCFLHKVDGSIAHYAQEQDLFIDEEDPWQEEKDKIDQDYDNYIKCEPMDSHQAFRVMEKFIDQVDSASLRQQLIDALNRRKPFQNFKYLVETSAEYRQPWFDFRLEQNVVWVEEQIEAAML